MKQDFSHQVSPMGLLDRFRRTCRLPVDTRLVGRWYLVRSDDEIDAREGVTVDFSADGELTYTIHQADRLQVINLVYHVVGDQVITDQPTAPSQERTRYSVEGDLLILENQCVRSWFSRGGSEEA
jgi:hypothetical protein